MICIANVETSHKRISGLDLISKELTCLNCAVLLTAAAPFTSNLDGQIWQNNPSVFSRPNLIHSCLLNLIWGQREGLQVHTVQHCLTQYLSAEYIGHCAHISLSPSTLYLNLSRPLCIQMKRLSSPGSPPKSCKAASDIRRLYRKAASCAVWVHMKMCSHEQTRLWMQHFN